MRECNCADVAMCFGQIDHLYCMLLLASLSAPNMQSLRVPGDVDVVIFVEENTFDLHVFVAVVNNLLLHAED